MNSGLGAIDSERRDESTSSVLNKDQKGSLAMKCGLWLPLLLLCCADTMAVDGPAKVVGAVVDKGGRPLAGVRVASFWTIQGQAGLRPNNRSPQTDSEGHFSMVLDGTSVDTALLAFDSSGKLGGLAVVSSKHPDRPLRIEVAPLVELRGRFTCGELNEAPAETGVWIGFPPTGQPLLTSFGRGSTFVVRLPPGEYRWVGHSRPDDYDQETRNLTLSPGKAVDMGTIDLRPTTIKRSYGKTPPAIRVTDARGIRPHIQLSDLRGKWVVIDFWGYWCGPCVSRSLPVWMDFCEDHAADRGAFEILAFHDSHAKSFAELDEKLSPIIKRLWRGQSLPFPILLDATGQTVSNYGISKWPTTLLIDPAGHLVKLPDGMHADEFLASKLLALPEAKRVARALDRDLGLSVDDDMTLGEQIAFLSLVGRIKIQIDPEVLKSTGAGEAVVPLSLRGRLTLRAWLNLTLRPYRLTYVRRADGLQVVPQVGENSELSRPSKRQRGDNQEVHGSLKAAIPFDFHDVPLNRAIAHLQAQSQVSFVLDPAGRKSGLIRPEMTVTGKSSGRALEVELQTLFNPLGLTFVVRDELVLITPGP